MLSGLLLLRGLCRGKRYCVLLPVHPASRLPHPRLLPQGHTMESGVRGEHRGTRRKLHRLDVRKSGVQQTATVLAGKARRGFTCLSVGSEDKTHLEKKLWGREGKGVGSRQFWRRNHDTWRHPQDCSNPGVPWLLGFTLFIHLTIYKVVMKNSTTVKHGVYSILIV